MTQEEQAKVQEEISLLHKLADKYGQKVIPANTPRTKKEEPPITLSKTEIGKITKYLNLVREKQTKLVLGVGGVGTEKHLTFHTLEGYTQRKKHAEQIREKLAKAGTQLLTEAAKKESK